MVRTRGLAVYFINGPSVPPVPLGRTRTPLVITP